MKKIEYKVPENSVRYQEQRVVKVSCKAYSQITRIAHATRLPIYRIVDDLLTAALENVELVEVPLYEMQMREEEGNNE